MIFKLITINLIYTVILIFELLYLVANNKNKTILKKYHDIYLFLILSIILVFLLNPNFFSDFIGIKNDAVYYVVKERIELILSTLVVLCYNYRKVQIPLHLYTR